MDFEPLIDKKKEKLDELEAIMSAEDFYSDPKQAAEISKEYNYIKKLLEDWDLFANSRRQLKENRELVEGDDEEMAALAQEEMPELETTCEKLELQIPDTLRLDTNDFVFSFCFHTNKKLTNIMFKRND